VIIKFAQLQIWEVVYGKDNQVKEVVKVMQLKGHKSAVTWLCFTWDSEGIITASKDGSIRVWNINGMVQASLSLPSPFTSLTSFLVMATLICFLQAAEISTPCSELKMCSTPGIRK
jgi:WD40 repeat protein